MPNRPAPRVSPRKRPVQDRSRHTVLSILEATAQVLVAQGYEKTNTGAIAERAGVSIGTLYQYYPNKQSLVADLIALHVAELVDAVQNALTRSRSQPVDGMLRAVVKASVDAHRMNPALHKVIIEQVPREGKLADALGISQRLGEMLFDDLRQRYAGLDPQRVRLAAFVLETTIEALTHRAVIEGPNWLKTGQIQKEAHALLGPYLVALGE